MKASDIANCINAVYKELFDLEAENTHLKEQNEQLIFSTELLVKELNSLKEEEE